jgi:hypothetical protein
LGLLPNFEENMFKYTIPALLLALAAPAANAATIDLTDNSFTNVTYESFVQGPTGPIIAFTETVAGVSFSFQRVVGQFRDIGPWGSGSFNTPPFSADIGGGGGSVSEFTVTADADITLTAFWGLGQQGNPDPIFTVIGGSVISAGNAFSATGSLGGSNPTAPTSNSFVGGPLNFTAGQAYTFDITNSSPSVQGYLTALEFSTTAEVPVPAGLPLALGGLAVLGALRRRQRT